MSTMQGLEDRLVSLIGERDSAFREYTDIQSSMTMDFGPDANYQASLIRIRELGNQIIYLDGQIDVVAGELEGARRP